MSEFNKKNILILGAAKGTGQVIAKKFAAAGAHLILVDIDPYLYEITETLKKQTTIEAHLIDLSSTANVERELPEIIGNRKLTGIVYVTGLRSKKKFGEFTSSDWDFVINASLKNVFFSAQALAEKFDDTFPFFITLSSVAAQFIGGECVAYHCAKAGLEQLTRYLAVALGKKGVRVNAVCPGMIVKEENKTRFLSEENTPYRTRSFKAHPLGSVGDSHDIAEAVFYLASPQAKFITGQILVVDGGLTIQDQFNMAQQFSLS